MAAIRSKNTKPELLVRRMLHSLGYRFRLHRPDLPGKPDIVFQRRKKVVFVHGCFWHQHSDPACSTARMPAANTGYWWPKLSRNIERDRIAQAALAEAGWDALTVWACEIDDAFLLKEKLVKFLGPAKL